MEPTTTATTKEFRIPEGNLHALKERIEKLSKKAMKLCGEPIILTVVRTEDVERKNKFLSRVKNADGAFEDVATGTGIFDRYYYVTISGPQPKIKGWVFSAALDVVDVEGEKAVIVRTAPGEEIPAEFRNKTGGCDHCNTDRRRKTLYVLRKEVVAP
jgi:hypothetical protein